MSENAGTPPEQKPKKTRRLPFKNNPTLETRVCAKCKRELTLDNFWRNRHLPDSWCKKCRHADNVGREQTPEGRKKQRERRLMFFFHLAPEEKQAIADYQNGLCAICQHPLTPHANIDHDHSTGLIRGELCMTCNKALGYIRDDIGRLLRAIAYLVKPPAVGAIGVRFGLPGKVGTAKQRKLAKTWSPPEKALLPDPEKIAADLCRIADELKKS